MHEWTKPKFCMPLPGEIVVVRVLIGHALIQLPITVQRARNRWCNAETGKILEHQVIYWRSPTLEEVGILENQTIEVPDAPPAQTRSDRTDQTAPNFRVDPSTLFKLQALAAAAHAPPPPAEIAEAPTSPRTSRTILGAARPVAARRAVLHAHPYALRHPATMRPRAPEPDNGYRQARGGRPIEAEVVRTRFVPRTMR